MVFNLLGTIVIGIGAAGTVLMVFRLFRLRAPRWVIPAAAGVSMLGFQIWVGYSWHQRTADALPDQVRVVKSYAYSSVISPWTLIVPQVNRIVAVDLTSVRRNEHSPDFVLATIYLITRYQPAASGMQIFDCETARRADIGPTTKFGDKGLPENAAWTSVEPNDLLLTAVCKAK